VRKIQDTRSFKKRSAFSRAIGKVLTYGYGLYVKDRELQKQAPEAARNMEILFERVCKFGAEHPKKLLSVLGTVNHWWNHYYNAQEKTKSDEHYLIYTQDDHAIPFRPEEDILYSYLPAQIALMAHAVARLTDDKQFAYVLRSFVQINIDASHIYNRCQTRMPRFKNHNRVSLSVVQYIDAPTNCCPSLHIAYSTLIYNVAQRVVQLPKKDPEAWESVQTSTEGMVNSVLYTKQHSLADIAIGILLAQTIFERRFNNLPFNNLMHLFPSMAANNPEIPYGRIRENYEHAIDIRKRQNGALDELVETYLKDKGFPKIPAKTGNCYYNDKSTEIVEF